MPHIYVCFLWHMHQPFYKDLVSGEYKLPWTRMHAIKDYYGMVKVLEDFPGVHQTFNLVPSMLLQIEDYAAGRASDPFLRAALKPAEDLTADERKFILQYFFQANVSRMIYRYPRYAELYQLLESAERNIERALRSFDNQAFRDLQVLSQLAWFDEDVHQRDREVRHLVRKERNYSVDDQRLIGQKEQEICARVLPVYREFAARGQIEITTTPFYHPILPLLCDSNVAGISHPYVPLPSRFQYPGDARHQLAAARSYIEEKLGIVPRGLWPSEGSVSDEALTIAAGLGFEWIATDNGVLGRTLNTDPNPSVTYRPYLWEKDGRQMRCLFRDHYLSDLVGFVYSRMGPYDAAMHFLGNIRQNCAPILDSGSDALVPIFLDGENAWEYYEQSGRPFLRELYARLEDEPGMTSLTVSEALERIKPRSLTHIFPGSWINANFDVWIGSEEDNRAWEYLLRARQTYDRMAASDGPAVSEEALGLAYEELLIAEGSDWCWWYGPEHDSANRPEFDQLFRDHLANVYRALKLTPPEELSRPILKIGVKEFNEPPSGPIRAAIDGEVTSYFEWLGAGIYRVDDRSGAMHGHRFLVNELRYGSDGQSLYLRIDFGDRAVRHDLEGLQLRVNVQGRSHATEVHSLDLAMNGAIAGGETAFGKILEARVALTALGLKTGQPVNFQLSLWLGGLPVEALPAQGWLELNTAESVDWML